MKFFQFSRSSRDSDKVHYVGLSHQGQCICLCYKSDESEIYTLWHTIDDYEQALNALTFTYQLIVPIPQHYIWKKTIILPAPDSQLALDRYIAQILKQYLPITSEHLYIDYYIEKLNEDRLHKLSLFALRKNYRQPLINSLKAIFDCEVHCLIRAIQHLTQIPNEQIQQYCFIIENQFIYYHNQQFIINDKNDSKNTEININGYLPEHCQNSFLYLKALGGCLWNGKESI
ncbi:hypothetical protein C5N92_03535 [Glaesserella australis]|uniref:Competence protein ComA n=2 Tax=Glaesserella TaxID=2094023 RepID=A0A328C2B6_9PAST|nr:hypothetical protein [Glaesserella australis]AUI66178.1 hypothetical protein CJD39_06110 [Glaesserella sp. 15-184]RAL19200.1 hypothetical protein C5N92_03535 [Glaesserella australis]